ncbi:OB-fold-containig protein [Alteromonas sp. C1M14]|uniref:OB-fold-containig protein n=1 Tax=Alteromonas sp. C1M14 TaxID=2841567 RepID=UPI001C092714|nr:OB-fold-containig protein [Alteromonas sp. C1M14]MBU2979723.1 YqiJ family protein [Alteromonas sp. C1M14]
MSAFFFHDANFLFTAAIGIVVMLFLVELASIIIGTSILGVFDDIPDPEIDIDSPPKLTTIVDALALNRLPIMIWFILFLSLFSFCGLLLNTFHAFVTQGRFFAVLVSVPIAMLAALFLTTRLGKMLAQLLPKKAPITFANEDFIGVVAQITIGIARPSVPAEVKLKDKHGQLHYLLVEPFDPNETFVKGDKVILVKKGDNCWFATRSL